MCIAIPMRVIEARSGFALCEGRGEERLVDMTLVGAQPPGTWVLVAVGGAREVVDEQYARRIDAALDGLEAALRGEPVDEYFADLLDREPELPGRLETRRGVKQ